MLTDLLTRLSLRRACAGIYFELRTIRQMLEIRWQVDGLDLPRDRKQPAPAPVDPDEPELTEEQLAAKVARDVEIAILEGRDPGTTWRPDPNR
jgi:hypothetical protein